MERTVTHSHPTTRLNAAIALAAVGVFLLAACGGTGTTPQGMTAAAPPPPTMSQPYVFKAEQVCKAQGFKDHIHHGTVGSHAAITSLDLRFPVADLMSALSSLVACSSGGTIDRAIVAHYGLDPSAQLDILLEVVCLKWDAAASKYSYTSTDKCYGVVQNELKTYAGGLATWYGTTGRGTAYKQLVVIQRSTGSGWSAFDPAVDVTSTIIPYEQELDLLIAQNTLGTSAMLQLVPTADPKSWTTKPDGSINEKDYYQSLTWVGTSVTLDDIDHGAGHEYEHKGADLGSPCPMTCPDEKFVFWSNSGPRRPGC